MECKPINCICGDFGTAPIRTFDNGGETFDRYTAVFLDGSYLGMSEHPSHPQGFGQHGELQRGHTINSDLSYLGKEVHIDTLPADVQRAIRQDLE
jgi:hypothetical protein